MNTHTITETILHFLMEAKPGLTIHTPISNGELNTPYVLLSCVADDELIPSNNTWECSLTFALHSATLEEEETSMRKQFSTLCALLGKKTTRESINGMAPDFILYSLSLQSIEEPQTMDNDFIQTATFWVVVQF